MDNQPTRVHGFDVMPDTPKAGVTFYDQAPLLKDPYARRKIKKEFVRQLRGLGVNTVVGLDARGFLWAQALADELGVGLVVIRKKGKLVGPCHETAFNLEYRDGETFALQKKAVNEHSRVVIVDDVLATGGTAAAAARLVGMAKGTVVAGLFVLKVAHLGGDATLRKETATDALHIYAAFEADGNELVPSPKSPYQLPALGSTALDDVSCDPVTDQRVIVMWNESSALQAKEFLTGNTSQFRPVPIHWDEFPDTNPDITFSNLGGGDEFVGKDVVYFASSVSQIELVRSLHMLTVLPRQGIDSLIVPMAYMGSSTHERVTKEGVVASADLYAHLLESAMKPQTRTGPTDLFLYDIHAPSVRFYFGDAGRVSTLSGLGMFLSRLRGIPTPVGSSGSSPAGYGIIFPDLGAQKRFAHEEGVAGVPTVICGKQRGKGNERRVTISDTINIPADDEERIAALSDLRWIVCDDLVHSGGTAYECAVELRKKVKWINKIEFYATHAVCENLAWMDFLPGGSKAVFDHVHVTSSVPSVALEHLAYYKDTFTVWSLVPDIMHRVSQRIPDLRVVLLEAASQPPLRVTEAQLARIVFETRSPCKVAAIKRIFPHAQQTPEPVNMAQFLDPVPPQPVGLQAIERGCRRRCESALGARNGIRGARAAIAVESGLSEPTADTPSVYDLTGVGIMIRTPHGSDRWYMVCIRGPRVPAVVWRDVMAHNMKKTAGEFIAERYPDQHLDHRDWYNVKYDAADFEGDPEPFDPEADAGRHSRSELISQAIKGALARMEVEVAYDMSVKYTGH